MNHLKYRKRHTSVLIFYFILGINSFLYSQAEIIPIWPDAIPNAITNKDYQEIALYKDGKLYNSSKETLIIKNNS